MSLVRTLDWLRDGLCLHSAIRLGSAPCWHYLRCHVRTRLVESLGYGAILGGTVSEPLYGFGVVDHRCRVARRVALAWLMGCFPLEGGKLGNVSANDHGRIGFPAPSRLG